MFHNTKKKQIILVRHAKALELDEFKGMDFDRPLSLRGESSIRIMSQYIRLIGIRPDAIIASPSKRTKQTAEGIAVQFPQTPIEYVPNLYNGGSAGKRDPEDIYLSLIHKLKKDTTTLVIVAHNDDLTEVARYLTDDGVPVLKKGSMTVLSVPEGYDWKDVKKGSLTFVYYLTPQFLRLEDLI